LNEVEVEDSSEHVQQIFGLPRLNVPDFAGVRALDRMCCEVAYNTDSIEIVSQPRWSLP
jgi:hypothetical protein